MCGCLFEAATLHPSIFTIPSIHRHITLHITDIIHGHDKKSTLVRSARSSSILCNDSDCHQQPAAPHPGCDGNVLSPDFLPWSPHYLAREMTDYVPIHCSAAGAGRLYSRAYKHLSRPRPRHALNHRTRTADKITSLLAPECLGRSSEDRFG